MVNWYLVVYHHRLHHSDHLFSTIRLILILISLQGGHESDLSGIQGLGVKSGDTGTALIYCSMDTQKCHV